MQFMKKPSAFIITKNEDRDIGDCLKSTCRCMGHKMRFGGNINAPVFRSGVPELPFAFLFSAFVIPEHITLNEMGRNA